MYGMSDEAEIEQPRSIKDQEFLNQRLVSEIERVEYVLEKLRLRLEALSAS